jgi:hypothetical protein
MSCLRDEDSKVKKLEVNNYGSDNIYLDWLTAILEQARHKSESPNQVQARF